LGWKLSKAQPVIGRKMAHMQKTVLGSDLGNAQWTLSIRMGECCMHSIKAYITQECHWTLAGMLLKSLLQGARTQSQILANIGYGQWSHSMAAHKLLCPANGAWEQTAPSCGLEGIRLVMGR
tara:strand:- start:52 stop:417 length:366 start_codon:yes stop_codon:yes gene_type:complete